MSINVTDNIELKNRLDNCLQKSVDHLLSQRNSQGVWVGELSTSALSTATAVMALEIILREQSSGRCNASILNIVVTLFL